MAAKLTALIPCRNERANILECIESVRPIADEILIADSGSTDGTLEMVREVPNCRIIEREYFHSANFKNWAIPQARHPWVLIVDADERVTTALAAEIRGVLAASIPNVDGYFIGRKNHFLGYHIAHCGWNSDDVLRLFRRDSGRYCNRWVHAEIDLPRRRVRRLRNSLEHFTAWNSEQYWVKLNRYATWGALNYRDEGRRASLFSMAIRPALRFMQLYFLRLGFLDGILGFHVCTHTAFYVFLKQARLWELSHAMQQPDSAPLDSSQSPEVIPFPLWESKTERLPSRRSRAA
jgi:glycosyltransferase involved in cell wall biosynthesis